MHLFQNKATAAERERERERETPGKQLHVSGEGHPCPRSSLPQHSRPQHCCDRGAVKTQRHVCRAVAWPPARGTVGIGVAEIYLSLPQSVNQRWSGNGYRTGTRARSQAVMPPPPLSLSSFILPYSLSLCVLSLFLHHSLPVSKHLALSRQAIFLSVLLPLPPCYSADKFHTRGEKRNVAN